MKKDPWKLIGPGLVVISVLFVVGSYLYDQKFHRTVVEHMPDPADVPGGNVYAATLLDSDAGKAYLRLWEAKTRRSNEGRYDLEVRLNDEEFFRSLATVEGKDGRKAEELYKAYQDRYHFDRKLVFTVMMHSPVERLFDMHPERWMVLRLDPGGEYQPERWDESNRSTDSHRQSVVVFAREDGEPLVASELKTAELVFRDPAKKAETVLRWDRGE